MYRYKLEPYKGMNTRYNCPKCGKRKEFTRYIDTETGRHLSPEVGKCNRIDHCGYHYTQYPNRGLTSLHPESACKVRVEPPMEGRVAVSYLPEALFEKTQRHWDTNYFLDFLCRIVHVNTASQLIEDYGLGTSKHWEGATVFWQRDIEGRLRTGKIMLYNPQTGKRVKQPYNHITWVHTALKMENFNMQQCLFGEHLLKHATTRRVAVTESEKTAMIASVHFPEFIWLACGGMAQLSIEKFNVLQGYSVTLFPDINGYAVWENKAKELRTLLPATAFTVSAFLENMATDDDRKQGLDLADYIIRNKGL